jgi:amino acid permease
MMAFMRTLRFLACCFAIAMALVMPCAASACPLCSEAIANSAGSDDDEQTNFPRAMNQSIYLMLAVPYTAFAVIGFCVYRGMRRNEEYRKAQMAAQGQNPKSTEVIA